MKKLIFTTVLFAGLFFTAGAQCKGFAKKKGVPELKPYASNGRISAAVMRPGDKAGLIMTFNSDIEYRLLLSSNENIKVNFKVMDTEKNVVFDSKENRKRYFDFNVASTQQLIVEVECEDVESLTGITPEGCVAILTGYKSHKDAAK